MNLIPMFFGKAGIQGEKAFKGKFCMRSMWPGGHILDLAQVTFMFFCVLECIIVFLMNQLGHMRTNKNCPKYGEDLEALPESSDMEKPGGKSNWLDPYGQSQQKTISKKLITKSSSKIALVDASEGEQSSLKTKVLPVKFKCSSAEKTVIEATQSSDKPVTSDSETAKSAKIGRILISNKVKADDMHAESRRQAIAIRPPTDPSRIQVDSNHKRSIRIRQPTETDREQPQKKIVIKRTKDVIDLDQFSPGENMGFERRKTKRIVELSNFERHRSQEIMYSPEVALVKQKAKEDRRWPDEHERRRKEERLRKVDRLWEAELPRGLHDREVKMLKEQERLDELRRYEEDIRREREEEERQKAKKKKKKKAEFRDDYIDDHITSFNNRVFERERSGKRRSVVELGRYAADYTPPPKRRRGGGGEVHYYNCNSL